MKLIKPGSCILGKERGQFVSVTIGDQLQMSGSCGGVELGSCADSAVEGAGVEVNSIVFTLIGLGLSA